MGRVAGLFGTGDFQAVLSGVSGVIGDADYSIVNLECPVAGTEPVPKVGPSLQCGEEALKALKYAGFHNRGTITAKGIVITVYPILRCSE